MPNCSMCGLPIPKGQRVCSMCYGDIDYGRDGYYRRYMESWEEHEAQKHQEREQDYGRDD